METIRRTRPRSTTSAARRRNSTRRSQQMETVSFKEKILLQCIICGVFLAVMMVVNLFDSSLSTKMTGWVSGQIEKTTDIAALQKTSDDVADFFTSVKTLFGKEPETPVVESEQTPNANEQTQQMQPQPQPQTVTEQLPVSGDINDVPYTIEEVRIDTELLDQINNEEDAYTEKKSETP